MKKNTKIKILSYSAALIIAATFVAFISWLEPRVTYTKIPAAQLNPFQTNPEPAKLTPGRHIQQQ